MSLSTCETTIIPEYIYFFTNGTLADPTRAYTAEALVDDFETLTTSLRNPLPKAFVIELWLCKVRGGLEHEFVVFIIETTSSPVARSYILAERRIGKEGAESESLFRRQAEADRAEVLESSSASPGLKSPSSSDSSKSPSPSNSKSPSSSGLRNSSANSFDYMKEMLQGNRSADDKIMIFRTMKSLDEVLTNVYKRGWYKLSTLQFSKPNVNSADAGMQPRPLMLEDVLILLRTINIVTPNYHLRLSQCYWYAHSIYMVVRQEWKDSITHLEDDKLERSGTCALVGKGTKHGVGPTVDDCRKPETIKELFKADLQKFKSRLESVRPGFGSGELLLTTLKHAAKLADEDAQKREEERARTEAEKTRADKEKKRADEEKKRADKEKKRADDQKKRAEEEKKRADKEIAALRAALAAK